MLIPATILPHNNAVLYFLKLLCMDLVKQADKMAKLFQATRNFSR